MDDNTYVSEYEANEYAKRQLYIGDRVQSTWDRRLVGKICGFGSIAGGPPFHDGGNPVETHLVYLVALDPAIETKPIKEQPYWRVQVLPMHIDRVIKLDDNRGLE